MNLYLHLYQLFAFQLRISDISIHFEQIFPCNFAISATFHLYPCLEKGWMHNPSPCQMVIAPPPKKKMKQHKERRKWPKLSKCPQQLVCSETDYTANLQCGSFLGFKHRNLLLFILFSTNGSKILTPSGVSQRSDFYLFQIYERLPLCTLP